MFLTPWRILELLVYNFEEGVPRRRALNPRLPPQRKPLRPGRNVEEKLPPGLARGPEKPTPRTWRYLKNLLHDVPNDTTLAQRLATKLEKYPA